MPFQRDHGTYYMKRTLDGFGQVYRSLRTDRKALARTREDMIRTLAKGQHREAVRLWLEGEISLSELQEAYETSKIPSFLEDLQRQDETLARASKAALRDKAPDVKDSTHRRYTTGLTHFRNFCGDEAELRECLTTDQVQEFKAWRLEEVAEQTVNNDLGAVSILVTYAKRQGWIDERPKIKRFPYKVRIRYLDPEKYRAYISALRPAFRPLMNLLIGTGMRLGEAEALRVSDLRLGNGEARAEVKDAKTASGIRSVFVPCWAADVVEAHIEEQGRTGRDHIFPFARRTTQKEHNRTCNAVTESSEAKVVIDDYTIHDHRHTAAVALARAGMPLHLLQRQLGHASIDQTMKYARFHPDYSDVSPYFDRMGERFGVWTSES